MAGGRDGTFHIMGDFVGFRRQCLKYLKTGHYRYRLTLICTRPALADISYFIFHIVPIRDTIDTREPGTFVRFAREQGVDELIRCLRRNQENHILYHYEGQLTGDYDQTESEEEILAMIRWGRSQRPEGGGGDQT